jgi:uncharacterized protein (DUF2147 family)
MYTTPFPIIQTVGSWGRYNFDEVLIFRLESFNRIVYDCSIKITSHMKYNFKTYAATGKLLSAIIALMFTLIQSNAVQAQSDNGDAIVGVWETGTGKARVKITKSGNFYYGRIVWLKEPNNEEGKPKVDKNNPDETQRQTPLLGLRMLKGFEFKGNNLWEDGTIYDPESGSTYSCKINLQDDNTMNIRGFIGISALGRTDMWKRVQVKG